MLILIGIFPKLALCEDLPKPYSFQGVELNSDFDSLPEKFREDCFTSKDKKSTFCTTKTKVGRIESVVDFGYHMGKLLEINIYFPWKEKNLMWAALSNRWGREDVMPDNTLMWRKVDSSGSMIDWITITRPEKIQPSILSMLPPDDGNGYGLVYFSTLRASIEKTTSEINDIAREL